MIQRKCQKSIEQMALDIDKINKEIQGLLKVKQTADILGDTTRSLKYEIRMGGKIYQLQRITDEFKQSIPCKEGKISMQKDEVDATSTEVVCSVVERHITRTAELVKRYKQRKQELERKKQDNPKKTQSIQKQIDETAVQLNFWINESNKLQNAQVDLDCK